MTAVRGSGLERLIDHVRDSSTRGDGELLALYRSIRDQEAFGFLVRRHGPMVLGVCRRVLRDVHAADDAFQATFLVLAKKADRVRPPDRLAPWLFGVAFRTAMKARGRAFRRQQVEQDYATRAATVATSTSEPLSDPDDLRPIIDEQLNALPEKYRTPLVLCAMQGLNKAEVAARLGVPEGTVSSRLARAREMLRERLTRRGVVVPGAALAALLTEDSLKAAVPPALATVAAEVAEGTIAIPQAVLTLSQEVIGSMALLKVKYLGVLGVVMTLVGGLGLVAFGAGPGEKKPVPAPAEAKPIAKPEGAQKAKPERPGENPKPNSEPEEEKPRPGKPVRGQPEGEEHNPGKFGGLITSVDEVARTITLRTKGKQGAEKVVVALASDARLFVDGKEAKLSQVPRGAMAGMMLSANKGLKEKTAEEVRVTGATVIGLIQSLDSECITLSGGENVNLAGGEDGVRTFVLAPDVKVQIYGEKTSLTDLKVGSKIVATLKADGSAVQAIVAGSSPEGNGKHKQGTLVGTIAGVNVDARTITLTSQNTPPDGPVVTLAPKAKVYVDEKEVKLANVPTGECVTFTLIPGQDSAVKVASEVRVTGLTITAFINEIDGSSMLIANKRGKHRIGLPSAVKVVIDGKKAKLADLKVGDRVSVTLVTDGPAALSITVLDPFVAEP